MGIGSAGDGEVSKHQRSSGHLQNIYHCVTVESTLQTKYRFRRWPPSDQPMQTFSRRLCAGVSSVGLIGEEASESAPHAEELLHPSELAASGRAHNTISRSLYRLVLNPVDANLGSGSRARCRISELI